MNQFIYSVNQSVGQRDDQCHKGFYWSDSWPAVIVLQLVNTKKSLNFTLKKGELYGICYNSGKLFEWFE